MNMMAPHYFLCILLIYFNPAFNTPVLTAVINKPRTRVIISTDIAAGLQSTNGDAGHMPYKPANSSFGVYGVQDADDGLAVLMALNSKEELDVAAVIPTFGNAGLAPEMLVAKLVLRELKNIPMSETVLAPGATGPTLPVFSRPPRYNMTGDPGILSLKTAFAASCPNWGVQKMRGALIHGPATMLALGPFTDVACLLLNFPRNARANLTSIIGLISQPSEGPMLLNNKTVRDFNMVNDPLAAALTLDAADKLGIPLILINWNLSSITSSTNTCIPLDKSTVKPPPGVVGIPASTSWVWAVSEPRNAFWASIFGVPEGPFDQYCVQAALDRSMFDCDEYPVFVQQCLQPEWWDDEPENQRPEWNDNGRRCAGEETGLIKVKDVPAQLLADFSKTYDGPLVNGRGAIPVLEGRKAVKATVCTAFAGGDVGYQAFKASLLARIW
jgi:inosine-uridine nucleoside N-ribohydrolase